MPIYIFAPWLGGLAAGLFQQYNARILVSMNQTRDADGKKDTLINEGGDLMGSSLES